MPRKHVFRTWDDYFIPGTSVLRNKFSGPGRPYGEPDADRLRWLEEFATLVRIGELAESPIEGGFDYDHFKAVHFHSFREGNTRAQFVFFSQLAEHAGYRLDPARFAPGPELRDEFIVARFRGQDTGDNTDLADVLRRGVRLIE